MCIYVDLNYNYCDYYFVAKYHNFINMSIFVFLIFLVNMHFGILIDLYTYINTLYLYKLC